MSAFPFLEHGTYRVTSAATFTYNCIAWAAGEDSRWWWPAAGLYYWPKAAPMEETVESFVLAFQSIGYETGDNGELEPGWEKVAIYARADDIPTHMARQLANGKWTSKLGSDIDIEHETTHEVEGPLYGRVVRFSSNGRSLPRAAERRNLRSPRRQPWGSAASKWKPRSGDIASRSQRRRRMSPLNAAHKHTFLGNGARELEDQAGRGAGDGGPATEVNFLSDGRRPETIARRDPRGERVVSR